MDAVIKLLDSGEEPIEVFAAVSSAGRNEENAAGVNGYKPAYRFEMWAWEYDDQPELEWDGKIMTIYRTYRKNNGDRIELYTEERRGRR